MLDNNKSSRTPLTGGIEPDVAVVGAGQSGLIAARLLASTGFGVTVVERLPGPGGQEPEPRTAGRLAQEAVRAGARLQLGTLAVGWDGQRLDTMGVDGAERRPYAALVVATGTRPATRGELGIAGDRCAGIVPGSAAIHLAEAGVLLGWRPAIVGGGELASRCASLALAAGARAVTIIAPDGLRAPRPTGARVLEGWSVDSARGAARLDTIVIVRGASRDVVRADALLLAAGRLPMRNVEGAVDGGHRVVFCHSSADPKREDDAHAAAASAAAAVDVQLRPDTVPDPLPRSDYSCRFSHR